MGSRSLARFAGAWMRTSISITISRPDPDACTVTRLQWGEATLTEELSGPLLLRDGVLELPEVTGRVAGGELRARARLRVTETSRNFFLVTLNGADSKKLLAPFPEAAGILDGRLTVVLRGQLGSETRLSGTLGMPREPPRVFRFATFEFLLTSRPRRAGIVGSRCAMQTIFAGSGRVHAELTANWGQTMRVEGKIRFTDLPLQTISPAIGDSGLFGNGRITGRFDIGGREIRSISDVSGKLVATLNNTSVKEIPILQQTTRVPQSRGAGQTVPVRRYSGESE